MKSSHTITFKKIIFVLLYSFMGMIVSNGCHKTTTKSPPIRFKTPGIKKVLVLPFENMSEKYGENASTINPISGKVFVTGYVAYDAESLLTRLLTHHVSHRESYQLISPERTGGIVTSISKKKNEKKDQLRKIIQIGKQFESDVVLIGHVYRFKDRIGSKYAAESAASVGFDLNMVNTHNGALIWSGHFDETQKALNENLFLLGDFLKRRGRWVTAEQMAATALKELVAKMPMPYLEP